jgi:hypothetical protein
MKDFTFFTLEEAGVAAEYVDRNVKIVYDKDGNETSIKNIKHTWSGFLIVANGKIQYGYTVNIHLENGSLTVPCLVSRDARCIARHKVINPD